MRSDEILTAVREAGRLPPSDDDWTDARVWSAVDAVLRDVFGHAIVQAKAGAWLKRSTTTTTTGRSRYRIPPRAYNGVCQYVHWNGGIGLPSYVLEGDQIAFVNAPSAGNTLLFGYYLRPSQVVQHQTAGQVTAVDTSALTVTVNSVPTDRGAATAVVSGDTVDIVHAEGWHELAVVGVAATLSGSVFTFPAGTDLTDVVVGDFLRADKETDWPCLPDDFHPALCERTAAKILRTKGDEEKAQALEFQSKESVARFMGSLIPRIKDEREVIVPRFGPIRGGRTRRSGGIDTFG